jgi:hypothetical protein
MAKALTREQRGRVAEKIMEWGNLVFVGLVIAQLVPVAPGSSFNPFLVIVGVVRLASAYFAAAWLMREGGTEWTQVSQ